MSSRYGSYDHRPDSGRPVQGWAYEYPQQSIPHRADAHYPAHQPRRAAPQRSRNGADYTLAHAGRQVRLGPVAFWVVVGSLVVMAAWSVATGTYFAFYDDVLKRLVTRQVELQFAYEDRIAELRAQVDRITSRQLLDQEKFEQRLEQLVSRQSALESRAAALTGLPDTTGSIRPRATGGEPGRPKPSPINDTVIFVAPPEREARLESRGMPADPASSKRVKAGIEGALARLQKSLDRVEAQQVGALNVLEESYETKAKRMRSILADLGLDPGKAPAASATGGPFVPAPARAAGSGFERQLQRINLVRTQVDWLTRKLSDVPVRKPVFGDIDMSSPFGVRMDPFVKGPAIHTGVDMRGDSGDPVRATANGIVTVAGWNGGYGKMVEIDHGSGLATRYGHLSSIDVRVGQHVRLGQTIGRIGSTGRSTGPHLHYETRVEGEAVDPQKFLRAGIRLGGNI